ncbi:MAG: tetratricopeptide repeat protein [Planctomycetaceae bacterium]|nr:tetratricopeptide repeat protein [Planctomycetaceae bacterium]
MNTKHLFRLAAVAAVCCLIAPDVLARGGRGGGGMARVGGSGGRPSMGGGWPSGGMSRPASRPSMASRPANMSRPSRPNVSRPSTANISRPRPSTPGVSRPSPRPAGGGPSLSNLHPSGGRPSTRPAPTRPQPGIATRPSVRPGGDLRPATRPGQGGGGIQRPDIGGISRPGQAGGGIQRPLPGDITRPGQGGGGIQRPRPDRPSIGDITRPGQGGGGIQRPLPGDITRPGQGGGGIQRPLPERPIIGGGGRRGDRPIHIGDNNIINRPMIGNIDRHNNWGVNRPGGDYWSQHHDWHDHDWHDYWHDNCIHDHHDWYHGCWNGNWGNNWYAPVVWGTVGWGLGAAYSGSSWGYGPTYYNPYYDTASVASVPAYDYSQPVVIENYVTSDASGGTADATGGTAAATQQDSPEQTAAMQKFDQALAAFKQTQYQQALSEINGALRSLPKDPVLHETRALCLFALGRYKEAAATLNSLLASAPGMDWTSMSSLYGNADDYTLQLRNLETHVKNNPTDAPAIFVLAYHYLVIGQNDTAIRALQEVVKLQPKDATAQRMLAALKPAEPPAAAATPPAADPVTTSATAPAGPSTNLVGSWLAKSPEATVELTITEDSQFTWRATPMGKPAVEVKGNVAASSDELVLETKDQGNMAGKVKSGGPDKFTFAMAGMPPSDPGLAFERKK